MVTDQQVALLRQRQMEGKKRWVFPDGGGHGGDERAVGAEVAVWPVGRRPSPERRWRTRPDPFDGVWEEEILPLLQARPPAGSGQRQLSSGWRRNPPAGSAPPSSAPCNAVTGLAGTQRAGSGGLLPPGASTWPGGAARLHPLQLPGSNHRRPALPPPAVPAGVEPFRLALRRGGCRRDLCVPEAGTAERALGTGRRAPDHTLRQQLGPHP